jgi:hypothetical protein
MRKTQKVMNYGTFEAMPAVFNDTDEAWVLYGSKSYDWRKMPWSEVYGNAGLVTEADFKRDFPRLPPLPKRAFPNIPSHMLSVARRKRRGPYDPYPRWGEPIPEEEFYRMIAGGPVSFTRPTTPAAPTASPVSAESDKKSNKSS